VTGRRPAADVAVAWAKRNASWLALALVLVFVVTPRVSPFEGLNQYLNIGERISEWMVARVQRLFAGYGYYVVFFGVLMENSMFLGLLVPGVIILILGGLAAENGSINVWLVLGLGIAATLIGDTISYCIGRLGWARMLERGAPSGVVRRVRETLESNRRWIILAYHFAGYSRMLGPAAAGMFQVPYRQWAPLDYLGATLWVIVFTAVGVVMGLAGVEFGDTERMVRLLELSLTAGVVGAVAVASVRAARRRAVTRAMVSVEDA
jgi:membrane-associated protein